MSSAQLLKLFKATQETGYLNLCDSKENGDSKKFRMCDNLKSIKNQCPCCTVHLHCRFVPAYTLDFKCLHDKQCQQMLQGRPSSDSRWLDAMNCSSFTIQTNFFSSWLQKQTSFLSMNYFRLYYFRIWFLKVLLELLTWASLFYIYTLRKFWLGSGKDCQQFLTWP